MKQEGEDLISIVTGITQWKGNVHIHVGDPITREQLEAFYSRAEAEHPARGPELSTGGPARDNDFNAFAAHLCALIDKSIADNYKIFPTHHIAYDLLQETAAGSHGGTAGHGSGAGTVGGHGSEAGAAVGFGSEAGAAGGLGSAPASASAYTAEQKAAFLERLDMLKTGNIPLIPQTELAASIPFAEDFPGKKAEIQQKKLAELLRAHSDLVRELFLRIYANPLFLAHYTSDVSRQAEQTNS